MLRPASLRFVLLAVLVCCVLIGGTAAAQDSLVIIGYNDLGMHCMNQDFSQFMVLPPYNTVHAQVIARGSPRPRFLTTGITVGYSIPGNTYSVGKTNFWSYAKPLLGVSLRPNIGLTGNGLTGQMSPTGDNDWVVTGLPITPITDAHFEDPYQLALLTVSQGGVIQAQTQPVVPVSWEINCDLCHNGIQEDGILSAHDEEHGTNLRNSTPVFCGGCHAQAPLGTTGSPSLSHAMHSSHADRMESVRTQLGGEVCYACHPGIRTQCLRDVHYAKGMGCEDCHTSMQAVGAEGRRPWVDEPKCGACHTRAGFAFEEPGKLYRDSKGHGGVHCEACHGSPHALAPSTQPRDNVQAIALQGHAGPLDDCLVCHTETPSTPFWHRAQEHPLTATATCLPAEVASGGSTLCTASAVDSLGHSLASWEWSDGGAGGSFSPSAAVQNPTYTAAANLTGADRTVTLSVTVICDGVPSAMATASDTLLVHPAHQFADIPVDFWARADIEACYAAGIVQGFAGNTYGPSLLVNRAQVSAFLARALAGGEANVPPGPATPTFPDVPSTFWAYPYIEYVSGRHVVVGYADGFHPAETALRDQMAVFIARSIVNPTGDAGLAGYIPPVLPTFPDVPPSYWAYPYIEYCYAQGVINGYADGYHPTGTVDRAQMAVFVSRAFHLRP